jgi:hypothetical protein
VDLKIKIIKTSIYSRSESCVQYVHCWLSQARALDFLLKSQSICWKLAPQHVVRVKAPKSIQRVASTHSILQSCTLNIVVFRATSHTRLRARAHYTSSTLIGGKGGAGPSLLHTMLEGPMEHVNERWMWRTDGVWECKMMDVESTWDPTWHQMNHVSWSLGLFSKTTSCM